MEHVGEPPGDSGCGSLGDDLAGDLIGQIAAAVVIAPFILPKLALNDDYSRAFAFAKYPYADYSDGIEKPSGKSWILRAGASRIWEVHGTQAWRGDLSLTTSSRFGVDAAYTRFNENVGDASESLAFLEILPTFTFARSENSDWRAGLGYESVEGQEHHDRVKLAYGVRYWSPWKVRLDVDLGASLASGKPIFELAPGLAYVWNRYEIKAIYRRLSISGVTLQGPELSVGVWF